ncbi:hypothetical protein GCM10010216_55650 [Streptomyces flaveolus]|nr:hypothetical protein GCM10010216_55650 [Streptomyces flaveolus]
MARQKRITVATDVSARLPSALMDSSDACAGSASTASATRRSEGAREGSAARMPARVPAGDASSAGRSVEGRGSWCGMGRSLLGWWPTQ